MKKKLLVLVALMLCMVTVLASCATSMKFEKVVGDAVYNDENPALTTAAKVDVVGTKTDELGDLVVFEGENDDGKTVTTVYNLATGAVVYTSAVTAEEVSETEVKVTTTRISTYVALYEYEGVSWFMVGTQKRVTTVKDGETDTESNMSVTLRNAKGEEFASISNTKGVDFATKLDLILVDSAMYRIAEDGTIAKAFDVKAGADFPAVDKKQGDYYYDMVDEDGYELGSVAVYNASLELIAYHEVPRYLEGQGYFIMNNGNVLLQGAEYLGEFAEKYDWMEDGEKLDLHTFVLNVEKGTVKELDLDYYIENVQTQAAAEDWLYNEKIENVAWIVEIEDEKLDWTDSATKLVSLDNNGKVKGVIDGLVANQAPELPELVATNRWVVKDLAGNQYLLNEAGEVLGNVNGLDLNDLNPNYIVLNDKIYDWDLNLKYNVSANDASILQKMEHGVLMTNDDGETLLYANGEVKTIISETAAEKADLIRIFAGNVATDEWQQISYTEYSALQDSEDWKDEDLKREWNSQEYEYFKKVYVLKYADIFFVAVKNDDNEITYKLYNDLGAEITSIHEDTAVFAGTTAYVCTADSVNATLIRGTYTNPDNITDIKTVYYRIG